MTLIICERIGCMHNRRRIDENFVCNCGTIGITTDMRCDSYIDVLKGENESGVAADAERCVHPQGYIKSVRVCGLCGEEL